MSSLSNSAFSNNHSSAGNGAEAQPLSGRYRFCGGQPLDPSEGASAEPQHPEYQAEEPLATVSVGVPDSPAQLFAMQDNNPNPRPEKGSRQPAAKVQQVLELLDTLELDPVDDLDLATRLVRRLEGYHDSVVIDLRDDDGANHDQIIAWAVDADRLMRSRILLESIDLD